jgi:hypothetical protein
MQTVTPKMRILMPRMVAGLVVALAVGYQRHAHETAEGNAANMSRSGAPGSASLNPPAWAHECTLIDCLSGVNIIAHLDASPSELVAGSFTACHQDWCWNGSVKRVLGADSTKYICNSQERGELVATCSVEAEGKGARMWLRLASPKSVASGSYADGDRVALRLRAHGKTVLDFVRYVEYDDFYPNGKACPPGCRGAAVEIWPNSPSGKTCSSSACDPYVRFERNVAMTEDTSGMTTLKACKNGHCWTSDLRLWDWGHGHEVPIANGQSSLGGADSFSPLVEYGPERSGGYMLRGSYTLRVTFRGDTRLLKRGDHYSVDWRARATGRILMKSNQTITHYDESYPGGRECTPVACKRKTFQP